MPKSKNAPAILDIPDQNLRLVFRKTRLCFLETSHVDRDQPLTGDNAPHLLAAVSYKKLLPILDDPDGSARNKERSDKRSELTAKLAALEEQRDDVETQICALDEAADGSVAEIEGVDDAWIVENRSNSNVAVGCKVFSPAVLAQIKRRIPKS